MSDKSLTPLLDDIMENECGDTPAGKALRREIRAVKRVAKEAAIMSGLTQSCHANGGQTCCQEWYVVRAVERLARLARSSRERGTR